MENRKTVVLASPYPISKQQTPENNDLSDISSNKFSSPTDQIMSS